MKREIYIHVNKNEKILITSIKNFMIFIPEVIIYKTKHIKY